MWRITPLDAEHVRDLAQCHITCWREAYRDVVPAHVLAAFDLDRRADAWERSRATGDGTIHVALIDDAVVGFVGAGPARDDDAQTPLELNALYVRRVHYGAGVADALIDVAIGPSTPCSLWVFEENPRAQAFYRRHGFTLDGARKPEPWSGGAMSVRMLRQS